MFKVHFVTSVAQNHHPSSRVRLTLQLPLQYTSVTSEPTRKRAMSKSCTAMSLWRPPDDCATRNHIYRRGCTRALHTPHPSRPEAACTGNDNGPNKGAASSCHFACRRVTPP